RLRLASSRVIFCICLLIGQLATILLLPAHSRETSIPLLCGYDTLRSLPLPLNN
ncbi:hypothetical protein L9F63_013588, partial [Diploptera punctata]